MPTLGQIIAQHRKRKHLSQQELSNLIGKEGLSTTNKSISNWEKNLAEPSSTMLLTLCKVLGITDLYGEYFGVNPDNQLSLLDELGQEKAREYMQLLIDSGRFTPAKNRDVQLYRSLRLFDLPASAGPGNFLDGDSFTELSVGPEVPGAADFGIRISGDSMEPQFISGQIVWVKRQETLRSGEIGIFLLNDEAYCKVFFEDAHGISLRSLNSAYAPIPITDASSFRIFGKVVG